MLNEQFEHLHVTANASYDRESCSFHGRRAVDTNFTLARIWCSPVFLDCYVNWGPSKTIICLVEISSMLEREQRDNSHVTHEPRYMLESDLHHRLVRRCIVVYEELEHLQAAKLASYDRWSCSWSLRPLTLHIYIV